jgi:ferric-dicitrate binding protein FerR (iron transport regulator)
LTNQQNIEKLFHKYVKNQCSKREAETVLEWLGTKECDQRKKDLISQSLSSNTEISNSKARTLQQQLQKNFENTLEEIQVKENADRQLRKIPFLKYAAAVIFVIIGSGTFWVLKHKTRAKDGVSLNHNQPPKQTKRDLAPGGNRALLTLNDGSTIVLDEAKNGTLVQQGNTKVLKLNGKLAYAPENTETHEVLYNTISTPRGGQYQVELPDGSQVWLNAISSIHFPTAFVGKERRVEITGEAYFEVAKNPAMPFKVAIATPPGNSYEIEVIGTHFNVMAYKDESAVKTTLLEGSVKINHNSKTVTLKPGQQIRLQNEFIKVIDDVDVEEVVAWKNGYFRFDESSLPQVMRQIARWYDVDISYEGKIPERRFGGKISRDNNASEVIKVLELSKVKFRIEDKKIIVTE